MGLILFIYLLVNSKRTYFDQLFIHLAHVLCHLLTDFVKELSWKLRSKSTSLIKNLRSVGLLFCVPITLLDPQSPQCSKNKHSEVYINNKGLLFSSTLHINLLVKDSVLFLLQQTAGLDPKDFIYFFSSCYLVLWSKCNSGDGTTEENKY